MARRDGPRERAHGCRGARDLRVAAPARVLRIRGARNRVLQGELGIGAVPTFVVDRKLGASGAQPPDALLDLLRQGWAKRSTASALA